jgi:hypothetical protein
VTEDRDVALCRVLVLVLGVERELHSHLVPCRLPSANPQGYGQENTVVFVSRQMLVSQETPSTTAQTGVRPHGRVTGGASCLGIGANVHPPLPGYRRSVLAKGGRCLTDGRCFAIGRAYCYHHQLRARRTTLQRIHIRHRPLVKRI